MRDGGDRGRRRMRMRGARGRPAAAARTEVDAPFGHAIGAGALRPALRNEERTDVTRRTQKVVSFRFGKPVDKKNSTEPATFPQCQDTFGNMLLHLCYVSLLTVTPLFA